MSTYIEGEHVHMPDVHGFQVSVPARVVHQLREKAKRNDSGEAQFGPLWLGRDVLIGAANLLDQRDACLHTDATGDCDEAAVFDLANKRDRCITHKTEN